MAQAKDFREVLSTLDRKELQIHCLAAKLRRENRQPRIPFAAATNLISRES